MSETAAAERIGRISAETGLPLGGPAGTPARTVFHAAERSAEFFDHLRAHYRETRRTPVEIPAEIRLVMDDGGLYDTGSATIRNISTSGALLGQIKLAKEAFPLKPFKIEIVMRGGDYDGIGLEALPIRFQPDVAGLGVKFEEIFVAA